MNKRTVIWSDGTEETFRDLSDLEGATTIVESVRKGGQRWFDAPSFEDPEDAIRYAKMHGRGMTTEVSTVERFGAWRIEDLGYDWRGLVKIRAADPVADGFPAP